MNAFLTLHEIASQRGDGLKPELVTLLERLRDACTTARLVDVVELAPGRADHGAPQPPLRGVGGASGSHSP